MAQDQTTPAKEDYNKQDVKFVREMIAHHEDAIKMANGQINEGKNSEVKALARSIKTKQNSEIDDMQKWLKDRGLSEESNTPMHSATKLVGLYVRLSSD